MFSTDHVQQVSAISFYLNEHYARVTFSFALLLPNKIRTMTGILLPNSGEVFQRCEAMPLMLILTNHNAVAATPVPCAA